MKRIKVGNVILVNVNKVLSPLLLTCVDTDHAGFVDLLLVCLVSGNRWDSNSRKFSVESAFTIGLSEGGINMMLGLEHSSQPIRNVYGSPLLYYEDKKLTFAAD